MSNIAPQGCHRRAAFPLVQGHTLLAHSRSGVPYKEYIEGTNLGLSMAFGYGQDLFFVVPELNVVQFFFFGFVGSCNDD